MLHDVITTPFFAEEPAKDSNPFDQLLGGGKKAAKEADKSGKQVSPCRLDTGSTVWTFALQCAGIWMLPYSICYWPVQILHQ